MTTTRYAHANFPTLPGYDAGRPHTYLIYLDANKLYGWAMIQPSATGGVVFLQPDEIEALAPVGELSDDAEDGYIYEVDLHYPQHLHDAHGDDPLAPEPLGIASDMYSPIQEVFPQSAPQRKLTNNLRDIVRYVVHYRNLKLYHKLGLVITKIYRLLKLKQSTWLKKYIDFNTLHRSLAESRNMKDFFYINEQQCFWEDTREFEETCACRTDYRRWYLTQTGCQTEFP